MIKINYEDAKKFLKLFKKNETSPKLMPISKSLKCFKATLPKLINIYLFKNQLKFMLKNSLCGCLFEFKDNIYQL